MSDTAIQKILDVLQQTGGDGFRMAVEYTYSMGIVGTIGSIVFIIIGLSLLFKAKTQKEDSDAWSSSFVPASCAYAIVGVIILVVGIVLLVNGVVAVMSPEGATIMNMFRPLK